MARAFQVSCEYPTLADAYRALRPWQEWVNATRWDESDRVLIVYVTDDATEVQTNAIGLALLAAGCGPLHDRTAQ